MLVYYTIFRDFSYMTCNVHNRKNKEINILTIQTPYPCVIFSMHLFRMKFSAVIKDIYVNKINFYAWILFMLAKSAGSFF